MFWTEELRVNMVLTLPLAILLVCVYVCEVERERVYFYHMQQRAQISHVSMNPEQLRSK